MPLVRLHRCAFPHAGWYEARTLETGAVHYTRHARRFVYCALGDHPCSCGVLNRVCAVLLRKAAVLRYRGVQTLDVAAGLARC